ncbi:flagellin [Kitasatospora sp. NPDC058397]|uniref:flagellin N-terminal helical domain-containing protein n=1 Tax=unclassified Kitasatospora TaxID=2633591 RepID=UPI003664B38A
MESPATNTASLYAASYLAVNGTNQTDLAKKLSSGYRINSAADDAAGMAVASNMTLTIVNSGQAARNANDGISLTQVTEGALAEVEKLIDRISLLATEALNGTYSQANRQAVQQEIQQCLGGIDTIGQQTQFNGNHVLGKDRSYSFQIGPMDGNVVLVDMQRMSTSTLGLTGLDVTRTVVTTVPEGTPLPADVPWPRPEAGTLVSYIGDSDGTLHYALLKDGVYTGYPDRSEPVDVLNNGKVYLNPLAAAAGALDTLNSLRGDLGSSPDRFQSDINTLNATVTDLGAARSRITDTDYAAATAQYIQANILVNAGQNVLAKVNQQPQMIMILVRDL